MWRYIVKRLLWMILIIFCVAILIFTVMYFVPGDPARIILGETASAEAIAETRAKLGLDQPYLVQLKNYLVQTFIHFDLGESYITGLPVAEEFADRLPRTFLLGLLTMLVGCGLGIPLGIYSAIRRDHLFDHILRVLSMLGVSLPAFWVAILLVQLFSLQLGWLPSHGIGGVEYWILPIVAGSLSGIGSNARMTRSAVLDTVKADYVTTARAKGQTERKVITRHMLPNAMIIIVSMLSGQFANLIGGSAVLETVFSFPGIGLYMVNAISNRDYPVIRSCVLILAIFSSFMVLLTDLAYAWLDPRIRAQYEGRKKSSVRKEKAQATA